MALYLDQERILRLLSDNLNNPQPEVVPSLSIAQALAMEPARTRQLLKTLDQAGSVISDLEGNHALITPQGLEWLEQRSGCRH